jgi:hypothetical protein
MSFTSLSSLDGRLMPVVTQTRTMLSPKPAQRHGGVWLAAAFDLDNKNKVQRYLFCEHFFLIIISEFPTCCFSLNE